MWFVVSKKRHQRELLASAEERTREHKNWLSIIYGRDTRLASQDAILNSTEREQVLFDLQAALNLVRDYQRAYSVMSMADPQISQANALLRKYGIAVEESATYLGFQRTADFHEPDVGEGHLVDLAAIAPVDPPKTHWEQEKEKWGDEAYGSGTVRIEAEAIDEGDGKEPGYTRAQVRFYDLDEGE